MSFGSGLGFAFRTESDPSFVNPVRSGPDFLNAPSLGLVGGEGRGILLNEEIYNVRELYLQKSHDFC